MNLRYASPKRRKTSRSLTRSLIFGFELVNIKFNFKFYEGSSIAESRVLKINPHNFKTS